MPDTWAMWESISQLSDSDEKDALRKQQCGLLQHRLVLAQASYLQAISVVSLSVVCHSSRTLACQRTKNKERGGREGRKREGRGRERGGEGGGEGGRGEEKRAERGREREREGEMERERES